MSPYKPKEMSNARFLFRYIRSFWCKHTCSRLETFPLSNGDTFIMACCDKCVEVYGRESLRRDHPKWVKDAVIDYHKSMVLDS